MLATNQVICIYPLLFQYCTIFSLLHNAPPYCQNAAERETLNKTQREEVLAAQCQGKSHVLAMLPVLHQKQQAEMGARQTQEVTNTHLLIQQVLDQKVFISWVLIWSNYLTCRIRLQISLVIHVCTIPHKLLYYDIR